MKNILICLLILFISSDIQAQEAFAKMVIGLEAGMDLQQFPDGSRSHPMPTLQVEFPFHKFSAGIGITRKVYSKFRYQTFDGNISSIQIADDDITIFHYVDKLLKPVYWSIPVRLQYRLPCNCVYIQGAASLDFFDKRSPEKVESGYEHWSSTAPTRTWSPAQFFKTSLRSYELGIGFKLHSSDYFRLIARPSFVWTENPETGGPAYLRSLRMTFGAQYAFLRYGGKK